MKKRQTKVEYWQAWNFFELLDLLHICDEILKAEFGDEKFDGTKIGEQHAELMDAIDDIEFGNHNDLNRIHSIFEATNYLTAFIKEKKSETFEQILEITSHWKTNNR